MSESCSHCNGALYDAHYLALYRNCKSCDVLSCGVCGSAAEWRGDAVLCKSSGNFAWACSDCNIRYHQSIQPFSGTVIYCPSGHRT